MIPTTQIGEATTAAVLLCDYSHNKPTKKGKREKFSDGGRMKRAETFYSMIKNSLIESDKQTQAVSNITNINQACRRR